MGKNDRELTAMEVQFVIHYEAQGFQNAEEAARLAGYKCPDKIASVVLQRPAVKALIAKRREAALATVTAKGIMDRDALLTLWSTVAQTPGKKDSDRLAASKLLAEFLGMFEKDNQDNIPRQLLQIVQCSEGLCPECGKIIRVRPVEKTIERPAAGEEKRVQ